jgi:hypothetical protein
MSETCYSGQLNDTDVDAPCNTQHVARRVIGVWAVQFVFTTTWIEEQAAYYAADCTDPTLQDPVCGTHCGDSIIRRNHLTLQFLFRIISFCSFNI